MTFTQKAKERAELLSEKHSVFKVLLIGDPSVGKSSLARMCKNDYIDPSVCVTTVGFESFEKSVVLEDGQTTVVSTDMVMIAPWNAISLVPRQSHRQSGNKTN